MNVLDLKNIPAAAKRLICILLVIFLILGTVAAFVIYNNSNAPFSVTFNLQNGEDPVTIQLKKGETPSDVPVPKKPGALFVGWYLDKDQTVSTDVSRPFFEETELYAAYATPRSYWKDEVQSYYLDSCPASATLRITSALSAATLQSGVMLMDETEGVPASFRLAKEGELYVVTPETSYSAGHTYCISLPSGASFSDIPEQVDTLYFSIEKESTLLLIYESEIIEVPESNSSAEKTLHAFTKAEAKKGDVALVGDKDKLLYTVSDVVEAEGGRYLLLSPIDADSVLTADVYDFFSVSLTSGTLTPSAQKNTSFENKHELVTQRLEGLAKNEYADAGTPFYQDDDLTLFLLSYENAYPNDEIRGDVIFAVYKDIITLDGKSYTVSCSVARFADIGVSLLYSKRESGDVLYEASISLDTASVSSLKVGMDGETPSAATIDRVSQKAAELLSCRTDKALSSLRYSLGTGGPELSLDVALNIDLSLFAFDLGEKPFLSKQVTSERLGVIGSRGEQRSYHRIRSQVADVEGFASPDTVFSSGFSFDLSFAYPKAEREILSLHSQNMHTAESLGAVELSTYVGEDPDGEGCIFLSAYGMVYPSSNVEAADFNKIVTEALGKSFFDGSTKPKDSNVTVSGDSFDASTVAIVPTGAITHRGEIVLLTPDREDITLHLRGERASEFVLDRENMTYRPTGKVEEDVTLYLDIYYPLASYKDGEVTLCKRTVTVEWKAEMPEDTVEATFYKDGELLTSIRIPKGTAPGYAGMDADVFCGYSAHDFTSLWNRNPFLPIISDTTYELTADSVICPVAFVYYYEGLWYTSFEGASFGADTQIPAEAKGVPFWTVISPYTDGVSVKNTVLPKLSADLVRYGATSYIAPEFCESENMSLALRRAWEKGAVCIYLADYGSARISVDYISGTEREKVQYSKNEMRDGYHLRIFSHNAPTLYGKGFAGWTPQTLSDGSVICTAEYDITEFLLTVTDENGKVVSEKTYPIGIIPTEYTSLPKKGDKIGVWLNSAFGSLVSWYDNEENRMISRDTVLTPYFGETYTVIIDADGGETNGERLPETLTLLGGEFDFSTVLPTLTKKTDEANSYEFMGWGSMLVDKDITLVAEYKETPHIYRIVLDAADGWLGEENRIEYTCTYFELAALRESLLKEKKPEKLPTASTLYTFTEWIKQESNEPYTEIYKAQYSSSDRYYTVKLVLPDGGRFPDGTEEKEVSVKYGDTFADFGSAEYFARIPSEKDTIFILDTWQYNGQNVPTAQGFIVRTDMTLTAVYKEVENVLYEITFSAGEGSFDGGGKTVTVKGRWGDPVKIPEDPAKPSLLGHTVIYHGWDKEIPAVFTESLDISAVFDITKNQYTVIYYTQTGEIYQTYRVTYKDKIPVPEPPVLNGGTFLYWVGLPTDGLMDASDLAIKPKYDIRDFYVIYYVDGEEYYRTVTLPEETILVRYPPTKAGYVFSGWKYPTKVMPYADVEVHGTFKKATYKVNYWKDGEILSSVSVEYGSSVTLAKLPSGADGWYTTDVAVSGGKFTMPIGNVNIYCSTSKEKHKVTYTTVDGTVLKTESLRLGAKLSPPEIPDGEQYTGKWLYYYDADYTVPLDDRDGYRFGDVAVNGFMLGYDLIAVPERKWTNTPLGKDINKNGVDDGLDLVITARDYTLSFPEYDGRLIFVGGYPTDRTGVCTDVIWRAYFGIGLAFKDLVDADIASAVGSEDNTYDADTVPTNSNINFRRVRNLRVYYERTAHVLTTEATDPNDWQPGDIVVFSPSHIGICSDKRDSEGFPLIIHHTLSRGAIESDELGSINAGAYTVVGHYRLK